MTPAPRGIHAATLSSIVAISLLAAPPSGAQDAGGKPLARTVEDPALQWGPCPELFPKGCEVAVLQGDPAKGRSDIFFRVPANYAIPAHWHTSPEHMVLVSGRMRVQYQGAQPETLERGEYAYGPAKLPHEARCLDEGPCVLFIAFESPIDAHAHAGRIQ